METVREIKLDPVMVRKITALAKRCELAPSDENLQFLFEYLVNTSLRQIEFIENFFSTPNESLTRPAPHHERTTGV